ncbi:ubiquinol-cytochrome c [Diplodia corticola]|uniref:Ubiquinol-cytochrome c n=1 Tax=Diplodia corticola TaxID=236234 RepID=A0A1J9R0J5_9PEZI|nr:ubiquinol-cytochrome c [Diplodia corticola]OJD34886.1 ubiquinol-cytochrome c [Diplodia corticola]
MASSFACRACKRALQHHASSFSQATTRRSTAPVSSSPLLRRRDFSSAPRATAAAQQQQPPPTFPAEPAAASPKPAPETDDEPIRAQQAQRATPGDAYASASAGGPSHADMSRAIAQGLRRRAGGSTETYVAYGGTEMLFRACARQAEYRVDKDAEGEAPKTAKGEDLGVGVGGSWWYEGLGLTPTFNTWAQITFLHMYALTTRIRQFPKEHAPAWHQHLLDHFFYEAENKMVIHHNMQARGIRNRYLQDLFIQWRGVMAAYDEALVKGDAMMAAALWRNIWKADEINPSGLATVVSYLRREIQRLENISDEDFTSGQVSFGGPELEEALVAKESPKMSEPFTSTEVEHKEEPKN